MLRRYIKNTLLRLHGNGYATLNQIELDRSCMLHNVKVVHQQHPGFAILPVLKANAYGHGLIEVARILNGAECEFLVVDGYFEAAKIRDITNHRILVMGYILPENTHLLDTKRCSFVVQDAAGLEAFGRLRRKVRIHLELNTGMNRMGLQPSELHAYLQTLRRFPNLELEGVMSHLADADNENDDSFTQKQVALFDMLVAQIHDEGFKPKYVHIAQTAGSAKVESKFANGIRLGIGLYGISPLSQKDAAQAKLATLEPVLELQTTIVKIIELQKGDKVSYNGIFTAPRTMRIGVLPLGYYEGVPRELSNKGTVTLGKKALPIVGRVCMNHTMIDLKDSGASVGDKVIMISRDPARPNSVQQICSEHSLFSYTLLTGLSSSIRRKIV